MDAEVSRGLVLMIRFAAMALILPVLLAGSGCGENWPCKKGKPCGNACISKEDTCHKG